VAIRPTVEETARLVLEILVLDIKHDVGHYVPLQPIRLAFQKRGRQFDDIAAGLQFAVKQGWLTYDEDKNSFFVAPAGFAVVEDTFAEGRSAGSSGSSAPIINKQGNVSDVAETDHSHTEHESTSGDARPSQFNNIVVVITSELLALPFCFSGTEGFMSNDWMKTAKGFGIGLPLGIAGLTFPLWGQRLKRPNQDWIQRSAKKWWPVSLLAAFVFVAVPEIYDRFANKRPPVVIHDPPSAADIAKASAPLRLELEDTKRDLANTKQQLEAAQKATRTPAPAVRGSISSKPAPVEVRDHPTEEDIAKATALLQSELESTRRELATTKQQLDAARQASHTFGTGNPGSIQWNTDFMLVVTGGGPNAQINALIFRGVSDSLVQMKSAYVVSELTGRKQHLFANIPYGGGVVPLEQIESIPAGAIIDLIIEWKPGLSIKDFQDQWGKIYFKAVYDDATYERHFDEQEIRQKIYREIQGAGGPRVTKKTVSP
jgi:hypothetical protein